ncbi:MAG: Rieske 2Fe-2S domain-containing protein [Acidimicrobiales bacterium]
MTVDPQLHTRRGERIVAVLLAASIAAAIGLAVVYAAGGQPQLEGLLLAVALGGLGCALVVWAHRLLPSDEVSEPLALGSEEDDREAVAESVDRHEVLERRPLLRRLLLGAVVALGGVAVFPIRSLGPRPGDALRTTPWRPGRRLVDDRGRPVAADGVPEGGLMTVFPEGHTDAADAVAVVVRVGDDDSGMAGVLAFSKLCTHAGCPVGLYLADSKTLLCPCHQSEFDVLRGAAPISGPAARALPELPLQLNDDGELVAAADFSGPVGPAWWTR